MYVPLPTLTKGYDKDWVALCQDNVIVSGISGHSASGPIFQYKVTMSVCALSQISTHPDMTLDVARR